MIMKEGQIIKNILIEKNRKMLEIVIRCPKKSDFKRIWKFDNRVIKQTRFLDIIKPISIEKEKEWFLDIFNGIKKKNYVYLLAEYNERVIGACTIRRQKEETYRHVGVYDIVVEKEFWGLGIGKNLTKYILSIAKNSLSLKIIRLILYSGNKPAEKLYKKFGFQVAGRIPKGVIHGRKYMDEIIFYKILK